MKIITLDFESRFSDTLTLSKMSTEAYCRHSDFELHGVAISTNGKTPYWISRDDVQDHLNQFDWSKFACLSHHAQFDHFILNHTFNIQPAFSLDTLSMARLILGNHVSVSLDNLRHHFGLPFKRTPYAKFKGKRWHELSYEVRCEMADGACDEVSSIWFIFQELLKSFPRQELQIIDQTIKMFSQPVLRGDIDMLAELWESENTKKQSRQLALNVVESDLQSAAKFVKLLEAEGIEVEYKNGKNDPIPAIARNDDFMRGLLEHPSERVRGLAEARLGVKSTLLQTRAETLGWTARRGPLPVYIKYAGARTLRDSGGDNANWQNFKRGSTIRKSIMAPEGHLLCAIDASQIEVRAACALAGQDDMLEMFRQEHDVYTPIASEFYGRPITKTDALERGTGKQAVLSCQYGSGAERFKATAKLGVYGPPVELSIEEAQRFVDLYRTTYSKIVDFWSECGFALRKISQDVDFNFSIFKVRNKRIYLEGCPLIYDTLEWHVPTEDELAKWPDMRPHYRVKTRNGWEKMYSSKLCQNLCEAVARLIVFQAGLRIQALGHRILCRTHDELLILLANDGKQDYHVQQCKIEMNRTPTWLSNIPLACDASLGQRYSK